MKLFTRLFAGMVATLVMSTAHAEWASAEIRRVDAPNSRMTLKHGEIKSLDMPPMTMVFYVRDPSLLEGLKAQDKIEFQASVEGKKYFVTAVRKSDDSK
jgi:Cu(I)/Ag(I) efflux system periplasmic protein CusF